MGVLFLLSCCGCCIVKLLWVCIVVKLLRCFCVVSPSPADSPDSELIELSCDETTPLGIQIRASHGQPGVFIHLLHPDSIADQSGLLYPGDRILEANGHDLKFASLDEATAIIAVCPARGGGRGY